MSTHCIGCGVVLDAERAELGYTYCTAPACQAEYRRGPTVTAVAVNKSGDAFRVAEPDEIAARAAAGEFATKNTGLGTVHETTPHIPAPAGPGRRDRSVPRSRPGPPPRRTSSGSTPTWVSRPGRSSSGPGRTRHGWASPRPSRCASSPRRGARPRLRGHGLRGGEHPRLAGQVRRRPHGRQDRQPGGDLRRHGVRRARVRDGRGRHGRAPPAGVRAADRGDGRARTTCA